MKKQNSINLPRRLSSISLPLFIIFAIPNQVFSGEIYQWVDENGKIHFSDLPSKSHTNKEFNHETVASIEMVKTPKISTNQYKTRKSAQSSKTRTSKKSDQASQCSQIKLSIEKTERKLRTKQRADVFDQLKDELDNLRWQKIKQC